MMMMIQSLSSSPIHSGGQPLPAVSDDEAYSGAPVGFGTLNLGTL